MATGSEPYPTVPTGNKDHTKAAVVIIGGGISGMCTAIDLIQRNDCKNFIILEKSSGVGGTWRDNKYPGCCCDVWSHLYSYSFAPNTDWTREYPGQEEILSYLISVAQKYELYKYIRFNSTVQSAKWDETAKQWKTTVQVLGKDAEFYDSDTYTINSSFLVSAVGQLNQPKLPSIPGLSDYKGKLMHSARWDWTYSLSNKRVAIIGNGATAAQIIPEIVKEVSHLTIHQRTPNWIVPRLDTEIPSYKRVMYKYLPYIRARKRSDMMDFRESSYDAIADNSSAYAKMFEQISRDHMAAQLAGEEHAELRKTLQPNYSIGCKRIIISDDYFPVFLRPNVTLETGTIDKFTEKGIVVDGQEQEYDLIICATGFKTIEFMHPINIIGSGGRSISEIWKEGGEALYGVTVESLPNFAMLYGPNTNLGHNSIILMIESQSRYINGLIGEVLKAKNDKRTLTIEPNKERVKKYNEEIQAELMKSSFNDKACGSWYKREDNGRITQNWSRTVVAYQKMLSRVDWTDYDIGGQSEGSLQSNSAGTYVGRVVEESLISYQTMAVAAATTLAVGAAVLLRGGNLLRVR